MLTKVIPTADGTVEIETAEVDGESVTYATVRNADDDGDPVIFAETAPGEWTLAGVTRSAWRAGRAHRALILAGQQRSCIR